MGPYILALDQGTTSSRALLFDQRANILAASQHEFPQIYPRPGWVEHNPEAIWESQLRAIRECLDQAGISSSDVSAVGITNQRETTLLWDRMTGTPLYNAIVWQCRRTAPMCAVLREQGLEDFIRARTGLVIDPYFSGTKLAWVLDNIPEARARAAQGKLAFGTIDTFLVWRLTNGEAHVTDRSNASRTMLYNIHKNRWDEELLEMLRIPSSVLPDVVSSSGVGVESSPEVLGAPVPIQGIAGDQQAATFGQACIAEGMAKNTYGTGCFLLLNTGVRAPNSSQGLITTIGWNLAGESVNTYCLEGSVFVAGAAVQWLRDELGLIQDSAQIEHLARQVPDNGGVYFVPAFVGLGAPYWDPYARGTIIGISRGTTAGHLARATLEAIAFQTRDVIEAMQLDAGMQLEALRVDGGAAQNDLLMQLQADILGTTVQRPTITETTALGAAFLAGLAIGVWPSPDALASMWSLERDFSPRISNDQREHLYHAWSIAVTRSRAWLPEED
jgi:glycerol kinase